jgi:hypothetical protein
MESFSLGYHLSRDFGSLVLELMNDVSSLFDSEEEGRVREIMKYKKGREGDQDGGNTLEDKTTAFSYRSNSKEGRGKKIRMKTEHLHPSPAL